jgi:hypothetical protein
MLFKGKRPNWYNKYHKSLLSEIIYWTFLTLSLFILLFGFKNLIFYANASKITTTITQKIFPGSIGISLPSFVFFTPVVFSYNSEQTSTAILMRLAIFDKREEGVGWSVTATCTNFFAINQPVTQNGENNTLTSGGAYDFPVGGVYKITIIKGGGVGIAQFKVEGLENDQVLTTGKNVDIGTRGLNITFANANYNVGDSWNIRADAIPVSGLTIFPQNFSTDSSLQDIIFGPKHTFISNADVATIMQAGINHLPGDFFTDVYLSLIIPANTYTNTYTAIFTITVD